MKAIEAVSATANRLGLKDFKPVLLDGYSNTLVHLTPYAVVARVATIANDVRNASQTQDCLTREIAVAQSLATNMAPAVRPSTILPPGPHLQLNLHLSFWQHVNILETRPNPRESGKVLHCLHQTLEEMDLDIRPLSPLHEAAAIFVGHHGNKLGLTDRSLVAEIFEKTLQCLADHNMGCRPLHGDAHHGNLWITGKGMIWGDFEDVCSGPIEWDLACLTASSVVFGNGKAAQEALEAYGASYDSSLLDLLITARTLQGITWALVAIPNAAHSPRLQGRLAWLKSRL